jgi:hypothetical protein
MDIPEYITVEEVKRVCKELNISDWTKITEPKITKEEAEVILKELNVEEMDIELEDFCVGLEVELEHGTRFKDANVTNNHPLLTGKIVLAHLKESLDYYKRLEVAELEGDLLKAISRKDGAKTGELYKRLADARHTLNQSESKQLG